MKLYRKSRNLIPFPYNVSIYSKNVKFTVQNDGGVYVKGKTGNESEYINIDKKQGFALLNSATNPTDGKYYISCSYTNLTSEQVRVIINQFGDVSVVVRANQEVDGVAYPMLNEGDIKFPYEPYTGQRIKLLYGSKNVLSVEDYDKVVNGVRIFVKDGKLTLNGTCTKSSDVCIPIKTIKAGTYSAQGDISGSHIFICEKAWEYTNRQKIFKDGTSQQTVTTTYDCTSLMIYYAQGYTYDNATIDLMLNKGKTALPYEKYFPLSKMNLFLRSRNLLSYPYYAFSQNNTNSFTVNGITYTLLNDGGIYVKGTATAHAYCGLTGHYNNGLDLGDTTIIAYDGQTSNTNGSYCLSKTGSAAKKFLLAYDSNNKSVWLRVQPNATVDGVVYPMLNEGETALPYEPPQEYPN